jgi:hypothetical protein
LYSPAGCPAVRVTDPAPKGGFLLDCLEMHAAGRHRAAGPRKEAK